MDFEIEYTPKGKMYKMPDGWLSDLPPDREYAIQNGLDMYRADEKCQICGLSGRYISTDRCVGCVKFHTLDFMDVLNYPDRRPIQKTTTGWFAMNPSPDGYKIAPRRIPDDVAADMITALEAMGNNGSTETSIKPIHARYQGEGYKVTDRPCKKHGHIGVKTKNGRCLICSLNRKGDDKDDRETPDSIMMRENPDMIIERETARALGMKVYRTGKPCRNGHMGFRYVSMGGCVDCIKEAGRG